VVRLPAGESIYCLPVQYCVHTASRACPTWTISAGCVSYISPSCGAIQRLHLFGPRGSLVSCKIPCYVHTHFGYHNKSNCWVAYVWRKKTTGGSRELSSCSGFLSLSKFASQSNRTCDGFPWFSLKSLHANILKCATTVPISPFACIFTCRSILNNHYSRNNLVK
jgi:hypothetical protein